MKSLFNISNLFSTLTCIGNKDITYVGSESNTLLGDANLP